MSMGCRMFLWKRSIVNDQKSTEEGKGAYGSCLLGLICGEINAYTAYTQPHQQRPTHPQSHSPQ